MYTHNDTNAHRYIIYTLYDLVENNKHRDPDDNYCEVYSSGTHELDLYLKRCAN